MTGPARLPAGGLIDRSQALGFSFDGIRYQGFAGDTLASALLANGVRVVARSFKYHRPRGIVAHGVEEPNALVRLESGGIGEPNTRATVVPLRQGLRASSQNCWPSVNFDLGAMSGAVSRLLPAGFYYKTFMWPSGLWPTYERWIRRFAGLGRAPERAAEHRCAVRHEHCDILVVGAGPAGLAAALAGARTGVRVMLVEQDERVGGWLLSDPSTLDDRPALDWVARTEQELRARANVRLLAGTTAFGYFDHDLLGLEERPEDSGPVVRRLWKVRARRVVLATGAIERPLLFGGNDRPGVMLAHSARVYLNRYAVLPGSRAVVYAAGDSAYATAFDLARAGARAVTVVDVRHEVPVPLRAAAERAGVELLSASRIVRALGGRQVAAVEVAPAEREPLRSRRAQRIECDLVCMGGGWNPAVHLHSQSRGALRYDERLHAFVPGRSAQSTRTVGAAAGRHDLAGCLADGHDAGLEAARLAGFAVKGAATPPAALSGGPYAVAQMHDQREAPAALSAESFVDSLSAESFVDFQNDVTVADVELAVREGYDSAEHVKRYTALGMGTDQGKLSGIVGLAVLARARGIPISALGPTTFRAPYTPVTFATLAGARRGPYFAPLRRSAMDDWHERAGASFVAAGLWRRPQAYAAPGESLGTAIAREARAVRDTVGLVDISTLGRIELEGPDAAEFLDRNYINHWKSLAVGRVRYGVMLREDGMVQDDGTTARIGEHRYLMTTTTANAAAVIAALEYRLQVLWPGLRVRMTSVTEQWAAMALSGPAARAVLERLEPEQDWSANALPHLGVVQCDLGGVAARVFRISYSGELAYEINVPAEWGVALWEALLAAGAPFGIVPYGTEAMGVLRIEKGHVAGPEMDGRTTPHDLGLGAMVSMRKDFIGARSLARHALRDPARRGLVGLVATDGRSLIPRGAQLVDSARAAPPHDVLGHVTSPCWSPAADRPIALALLSGGPARHGTTLWASSPLTGEHVRVAVCAPVFFDPEGRRVRA